MKYTFILNNLNCTNCAAKIEKQVSKTNGINNVSFNFATKKLVLDSENNNVKEQIQMLCNSIEDGVVVCDDSTKNTQTQKHISNKTVMLIISASLAIAAFVLHLCSVQDFLWGQTTVFLLSFASALTAGFKIFIKGFKSIVKLKIDETTLLTVAVIAAFFLGEFVEAAMVTVLFALGEIIEDRAVDASRRNIEKLAQIRPDTANVITDGIEKAVDAESVKTGSLIVVKPFERVPLDGVIVKGSTTLDNSALTGESVPVDADEGCSVLSGAINGEALIEIKTTKEFGDSTATRIIKLVEDAAAKKGQHEKLITRFASVYTPVIILISAVIAVVPPLLGLGTFSQWIYRALVCLVASCPCAIVISVPLSYYSGIGAATKTGILIKGGKYIESLSKADTFVFDKTGTLTSGKLKVNKVTTLSDISEERLLCLAAACEKNSSHPIALAIKNKADKKSLPQLSDYEEQAGQGTSATYKGKRIRCGGKKILSEYPDDERIKDASVFVLYDEKLIGAISVSDTLRTESKQVISELKKYGIKNTVMLTGDAFTAAENAAKSLLLSDFKAELMPSEKLEYVNELKKNSKGICFVGDGINDAPVLSASDCGIAMGFGSEAAIESADAVLSSGNLTPLPKAISISRKVMSTIKTNIIFAIVVKAAVIVLATLGIASMWMSVVADTGVSVVCVLYAARLLKLKPNKQ